MSGNLLFSLVYLTYRPGGIDLLAQSLACQPYMNYELLVIDGLLGRPERGEAAKYLTAHGLPLSYFGPPKAKVYPNTPVNLANAMNTGALLARAPWVVYLHDYSFLPRRAFVALDAALNKYVEQNVMISGVAEIHKTRKPQLDGDITVWQKQQPINQRLKHPVVSWIPEEFENFFCCVPIRFMELTNGIDERADMHVSWPLLCMVAQAKIHDWQMKVDRSLLVKQVNHHGWGGSLWHAQSIKSVVPISGVLAAHFAPTWGSRSENSYDFASERQRLLQEKVTA